MTKMQGDQPWWQLLSIQSGGIICLTNLLSGFIVSQQFGWVAGVFAVFIGNMFLLLLGLFFASISVRLPYTTVQHAINCFGNRGRLIFSSVMILSMLFWFGIQLNTMSYALQELLKSVRISAHFSILNTIIGISISLLMCFGMKTMKILSNLGNPFLILLLLTLIFMQSKPLPDASPLTFSCLGGVSMIIGAFIVGTIDLPSYLRFARSKKDAIWCILLMYCFVTPFIQLLGVYFGAISNSNSILEILNYGQHFYWTLGISSFILISGWATNNANLYSAVVSSSSLPLKNSIKGRAVILGSFGTLIGFLNPLGFMESLLEILSVVLSALGSVIFSRYLIDAEIKNIGLVPILSWIFGCIIGSITAFSSYSLTQVPALDAFVATFVAQRLLVTLQRGISYDKVKADLPK